MAKTKTTDGAERVVNKKQLAALVKESAAVKERTSSIAGTFGETVKNAVENGNLDKKAFNVVAALFRMKDELKRNATIRNIKLYIDLCTEEGLFGAEHVGDLDEMAREAADEGDEADDGDDNQAAYDAGYADGLAAKTPLNPHEPGTPLSDAYAAGWRAGQDKNAAGIKEMGDAAGTYRIN